MTDHENTPTADETHTTDETHATDETPSVEETTTDATTGKNPSREAAKYRTRLREVESERDNLANQVETLQKQAAEMIIADRLHSPAAIWANGTQLTELLNEDGQLDTEKVKTAADEAISTLGLAERPRTPKPHPAQRQGNAIPAPQGDRMAEAIRAQNW